VAGHAYRTAQLYHRRRDDVSLDEAERDRDLNAAIQGSAAPRNRGAILPLLYFATKKLKDFKGSFPAAELLNYDTGGGRKNRHHARCLAAAMHSRTSFRWSGVSVGLRPNLMPLCELARSMHEESTPLERLL
jgi:hypothetical protein